MKKFQPKISGCCKKSLLLTTITFLMLFPRPLLFFRQLDHYHHPEHLLNYDFPEMAQINRSIDSLFQSGIEPKKEVQTVQWWVYKNISYQYDWQQWLNCDYWPDAATVWRQGSEDCDGQAVLAAAILRSRGHENVRLAGNLLHIWVVADTAAIMNPMAEETLSPGKGKTGFRLPTLHLAGRTLAFIIANFPSTRILIIIFTLMATIFLPGAQKKFLLLRVLLLFAGYTMLRDWAVIADQTGKLTPGFFSTLALLLIILSFFPEKILKKSVRIIPFLNNQN